MASGSSGWATVGMTVLALVAGCGGAPPEGPTPSILLHDISRLVALPRATGRCFVFRDLDGDDRPDLLLSPLDQSALFTHVLAYFHNLGDGTFERHDIKVPIGDVGGCAAADYDA